MSKHMAHLPMSKGLHTAPAYTGIGRNMLMNTAPPSTGGMRDILGNVNLGAERNAANRTGNAAAPEMLRRRDPWAMPELQTKMTAATLSVPSLFQQKPPLPLPLPPPPLQPLVYAEHPSGLLPGLLPESDGVAAPMAQASSLHAMRTSRPRGPAPLRFQAAGLNGIHFR